MWKYVSIGKVLLDKYTLYHPKRSFIFAEMFLLLTYLTSLILLLNFNAQNHSKIKSFIEFYIVRISFLAYVYAYYTCVVFVYIVCSSNNQNTVNLVILVIRFSRICDLGIFTRSRISELSISMLGSAHNNNFRKIPKFANLSSTRISRKLKPGKYYHIYNIKLSGRNIYLHRP